MSSVCGFPYCHDDLDPQLPYLGPFENDQARVLIQPAKGYWLVHWYAHTAQGLIAVIQEATRSTQAHAVTLRLQHVPAELEPELLAGGFSPAGEYVDAWIEDLQKVPITPSRHYPIRTMLSSELMIAVQITQACREQARAYQGVSLEWVQEWQNDPTHKVFLGMDGSRPVGVLFAGLYGFDHPRGPVCWLREIAVMPSFQNRGLGQELLLAGLKWGVRHGAKRALFSVDVQNEKATHLYETAGFKIKPGRGQINLQCELP